GLVVVATVLIGLSLLIYSYLRRLLSIRSTVISEYADEERESLDGGSLFLQQLRDLFARRRRPTTATEVLAASSVRALYRDMLRAAAMGGLPRASNETPDEYAARLALAAPLASDAADAAQDLAALNGAYNAARYGGREPERAQHAMLRDRARRLIARLT